MHVDIKRKALSSPCEVPRVLNLARNSAKWAQQNSSYRNEGRYRALSSFGKWKANSGLIRRLP